MLSPCRSAGERTASFARCWASRAPRSSAALFDGFPDAVGSSGRCATPTGGSSTSRSATATRRCCAASASPRRRATATRCSRRCPRMRGSRAFDAYVAHLRRRARRGSRRSPTTPRSATATCSAPSCTATAKLGDGLMVFLTDVTEQRRMEAELRSYADVVAHDLREPVRAWRCWSRLLERPPASRRGRRCCGCCATASGAPRS